MEMDDLATKFEAIKYNHERSNENQNYVNEGMIADFDFVYSLVEQDLTSKFIKPKQTT